MDFFLFLWVIFALLDPDPDLATQINADPCGSGSGSETLGAGAGAGAESRIRQEKILTALQHWFTICIVRAVANLVIVNAVSLTPFCVVERRGDCPAAAASQQSDLHRRGFFRSQVIEIYVKYYLLHRKVVNLLRRVSS